MKHPPFNHKWIPLGVTHRRVPTDYHITDFHTITELDLFCRCGKVKSEEVAKFAMTEEQIERYVKEVYGV